MKRWTLPLILSVFVLLNCQSNESIKPIHGQGLAGTWLLYESGYSPGAGYIVDKVPSKPQQTLTFTSDGHLQVQGDLLKNYQSFTQFRLDSVKQSIRLYYTPSISNYSEAIYLNNDTLKLYQPCIEGCHLGFLRVQQ